MNNNNNINNNVTFYKIKSCFLKYSIRRFELPIGAIGCHQPPIQWVPRAPSPGEKRPGREADHPPPTNAEVKNGEAVPCLPHMSSLLGGQLIKHRDNITFTCIF
jgi:hypothetical protein